MCLNLSKAHSTRIPSGADVTAEEGDTGTEVLDGQFYVHIYFLTIFAVRFVDDIFRGEAARCDFDSRV